MIKFTVYGEPTAKGRPRFTGTGRAYTPEKTVNYENLVKFSYLQTKRVKFGDLKPLSLSVRAYCQIPLSASKKNREMMNAGVLRPTKKPDGDNILKIVADSLNGLAYRDDKQIVKMEVEKFYSDVPRIEIEVMEVNYK